MINKRQVKIQNLPLILGFPLIGVTASSGIVDSAQAASLHLDAEIIEISNPVGYTSKSSPNTIKALKFNINETNSSKVIQGVTLYTTTSAFPDLTKYDPIYWLTGHYCQLGGLYFIKCELILDNIHWPYPWPNWPKFKDTTYTPPDPLTDSEEVSLDDYSFNVDVSGGVPVSVPEPISILGTFGSLGFGVFIRKKYSQQLKK
jgi:hypothetical protein